MKLINYIVILCLLTLFGCNDIDFKENIKYYKNGKIKERFYTDKNQLNQGLGYEYYENGNVKEIRKYFNGKSNGKCLNFYQNGKLKAKGKFSNNVQIDTTFNYFKNGQIDAISIYDKKGNDIKDIFFFSSGRIYKVRSYFIDGRGEIIASKTYFKNGKINELESDFAELKYLSFKNKLLSVRLHNCICSDSIYINIIKGFNFNFFYESDILRTEKFSNINNLKIKIFDSDFIRDKINIQILVRDFNNKKISKQCEYNIQFTKDTKLPKDNVEGIYRVY